MASDDLLTIKCPACQRSLPPRAVNCQFCGADLANVERPKLAGKKKVGPEKWVVTLYYIAASYWIFDGGKTLLSGLQARAAIAARPELQLFAFIAYIGIAVGLFGATLGLGLLLKWEWARGVVNIFCWIRILLALMALWQGFLLAVVLGPLGTVVVVGFAILDLVVAGLQIWLISETENYGW